MESYKISTPIQVRFTDIDGLGHVSNSVYLSYYDQGRVDYFEQFMSGQINWTRPGMVIVSVKTDFMKPVLLHDKVIVKSRVSKIGNKSIEMDQILVCGKSHVVHSSCKTVLVAIDHESGESVPVSDLMREKVNAFENR